VEVKLSHILLPLTSTKRKEVSSYLLSSNRRKPLIYTPSFKPTFSLSFIFVEVKLVQSSPFLPHHPSLTSTIFLSEQKNRTRNQSSRAYRGVNDAHQCNTMLSCTPIACLSLNHKTTFSFVCTNRHFVYSPQPLSSISKLGHLLRNFLHISNQ
jgi:hypothetical protein